MRPGEVVLISIHFHQRDGAKIRPAVAVLDSEDEDFVGAPITSRFPRSAYDVAIRDWSGAGLNVPSWIRIDKVAVLAKAGIVRKVGELSASDLESLRAILCKAYCWK